MRSAAGSCWAPTSGARRSHCNPRSSPPLRSTLLTRRLQELVCCSSRVPFPAAPFNLSTHTPSPPSPNSPSKAVQTSPFPRRLTTRSTSPSLCSQNCVALRPSFGLYGAGFFLEEAGGWRWRWRGARALRRLNCLRGAKLSGSTEWRTAAGASPLTCSNASAPLPRRGCEQRDPSPLSPSISPRRRGERVGATAVVSSYGRRQPGGAG
mmetsp:Transcript_47480/g.112396  ORF Transcript_47480/g.112396 Transcript_47480/m.112396 type:complete len:208 (+) Transcript_47480:206-829(+)